MAPNDGQHSLLRLEGRIRNYAWGSRTVLSGLRGLASPSPEPEAELWFGSHPTAPSLVRVGGSRRGLTDLIELDPEWALGLSVHDRFGSRLPYLLKVLAIESPLSLQVHPSAHQATTGYRNEDRRGVRHDAPNRSYRDVFPKPELLVAIAPTDVFCGFRETSATVALLEQLDVAALEPIAKRLRSGGVDALTAVVSELLRWRGAALSRAVHGVLLAVDHATGRGGEFSTTYRWLGTLGRQYPDDPGVLVTLLLRHLHLSPGQAIFVPPGTPHAYLHGTAVEVMAPSDNVLRGGLTSKHVDVDGFIAALDPSACDDSFVVPTPSPGGLRYSVPTPYFGLECLTPGPVGVDLVTTGPELLMALGGSAAVLDGDSEEVLGSGEAAFVPAAVGNVHVTGAGPLFRVTTGMDADGSR